MKVLDLHCDTLTKVGHNFETNLRKNKFSIDFERLKKSHYLAQFFALFIDKQEHEPYEWAMYLANIFKEEISKNSDLVKQAYSYKDILENEQDGLVSCLLTIEEGAALRGSFENLKDFYEMGVRIITLTWNYANDIGYPNCIPKYQNKGLTTFGYELVEAMNELGIIVDVSHLSDKGFYDVVERCKVPFIASHSNSRTITNNSRNLTDDMIRLISEHGGIIGINFFASFLGSSPISKVNDMIKHIQHIYKVGGIDVLALGSDFDGITCEVELGDCSGMEILYNGLLKTGFKEDSIDKIFYSNGLRVIKEVLK